MRVRATSLRQAASRGSFDPSDLTSLFQYWLDGLDDIELAKQLRLDGHPSAEVPLLRRLSLHVAK